jgi:hypothetical protein
MDLSLQPYAWVEEVIQKAARLLGGELVSATLTRGVCCDKHEHYYPIATAVVSTEGRFPKELAQELHRVLRQEAKRRRHQVVHFDVRALAQSAELRISLQQRPPSYKLRAKYARRR